MINQIGVKIKIGTSSTRMCQLGSIEAQIETWASLIRCIIWYIASSMGASNCVVPY